MSYNDFQRYLDASMSDRKIDVSRDILSQIKVRPRQNIVTMTMEAVYDKVDPQRHLSCFEVFGYDFLVDEDFKVWLLEVNTNPCLELGCCLLSALIPNMLDNALRVALDPLYPPLLSEKKLKQWTACSTLQNQFELVFSEGVSDI
mmetsp:Transcript_5797/g.10331  ORF Transcript_5797/g.10331 Transcript_5797/m.10331 type:complete len:145 (-) Transcript_5797:22-456(-)